MRYQNKKTNIMPPYVRRPMQAPFSNQGLGMFRQRRAFSNPLDMASYEPTPYASNTESRMIEPLPVDIEPDAVQSLDDFIGATSTTVVVSGGGGGGTLTGTGTTNTITRWTGSSSLGNSAIVQSGNNIGIGTSSAAEKLDVDGTIRMTGFKMTTGATVGFVLTCNNVNGNATWQAGGGGGGSTGIDVVGGFFLGGL